MMRSTKYVITVDVLSRTVYTVSRTMLSDTSMDNTDDMTCAASDTSPIALNDTWTQPTATTYKQSH